MSWIRTYTGRRFDIASPRVADVDIEDIAQALSHIARFGGHTSLPYSVAQHSVMMYWMAPKPLKRTALLHDAAEAYLGDLMRPIKALLPAFSRLETRLLLVIGDALNAPGLAEISPEIHELDKRLCATEQAFLQGPELAGERRPDVLDIDWRRLRPWDYLVARCQFLKAWRALGGKESAHAASA